MNARRAKAIRREARRQGIDPLARTTAYPLIARPVPGKPGYTVPWPAPAINDERRAYRRLKKGGGGVKRRTLIFAAIDLFIATAMLVLAVVVLVAGLVHAHWLAGTPWLIQLGAAGGLFAWSDLLMRSAKERLDA